MTEALAEATRALAAVSDTPRLDAELLLAHALGITRERLLLGDHRVPPSFAALIERRLAHEPIAYILGERDFWTITLCVTPAVLIPRADSETLIEAAAAHFGRMGPRRVLDLGTGSGALLLAALDQWPNATGLGIDASQPALEIARQNAVRIAPGRAHMYLGNWADGIGERFDLILCNPPYVEDEAPLDAQVRDYEPAVALFAGADGLDAYRTLAPQFGRLLNPLGIACIEIGANQAAAVTALLKPYDLTVSCRKDLAGRDRCIVVAPK